MENNILKTIKCLLWGSDEENGYDRQLLITINTIFNILTQMGVGDKEGFALVDGSETWDMFLPDSLALEMVKTYIHLRCWLIFDPPAANVREIINAQLDELNFRINSEVNYGLSKVGEVDNNDELTIH